MDGRRDALIDNALAPYAALLLVSPFLAFAVLPLWVIGFLAAIAVVAFRIAADLRKKLKPAGEVFGAAQRHPD